MYATVADLREEGVTESQASDTRLTLLLEEATLTIDRIAGWFFEPREIILRLSGRGTPSIEPPFPPIQISNLVVNGSNEAVLLPELNLVGAPVRADFVSPSISWRSSSSRIFPKGDSNVEMRGWWGYTEPESGNSQGRTPLEIRRACMLMVMRNIPRLSDDAAEDVRNRWRIIEEKTRDQSYKLDKPSVSTSFSGDPGIDDILVRYLRPSGLGAA